MAGGTKSVAIRLLLILAAAIVLFAFIAYYHRAKTAAAKNERFSQLHPMPLAPAASHQLGSKDAPEADAPLPSAPSSQLSKSAASMGLSSAPAPNEPLDNEQYMPVKSDAATRNVRSPADPFPQDRITPEQLLPKNATDTKWAQVNPAGQGDVKDQNFLTAGYHIGFNTQGNSLRNASHDLRSSIPNPRHRVSIWQQSTIEPDIRRPLE